MVIYLQKMRLPIGDMIAGVGDDGIYLFDFEYRNGLPRMKQRVLSHYQATFKEEHHANHDLLQEQLDEYFKGFRTGFNLPIKLSGSSFQQRVWEALLEIPFGETRSYKQQSILLGNEKAIRAVASANGANCLAVIIPCHRVIGTNRSLTGYAGGLPTKKWLLEHESKYNPTGYQKELF